LNWEQTVKFIRSKPEYEDLVEKAYFEEDLPLNVERFKRSAEFAETIKLIRQYAPNANTILDIGSGNGISAIAFALEGYNVIVSEPDPSITIGAGAIKKLAIHYNLDNVKVYENCAEEIGFPADHFDIVYVRQAMHHAYDLNKFIKNLALVLKKGGTLFTIRDHVIYDESDKERFLKDHPLHKYYGGENAFTSSEYRAAFAAAGLAMKAELKFYDSLINYFPFTPMQIQEQKREKVNRLKSIFYNKLGLLSKLPGLFAIYKIRNKAALVLNEKDVAGRMYSYILQK